MVFVMDEIFGWKTYLLVPYYLFVSFLVILIILEHKKPEKAFAYIFLMLLFPILGVILYFLFGFHYQRKVFYTRMRNCRNDFISSLNKKKGKRNRFEQQNVKKLSNLFYNIDRVQFTAKNEVQILRNGEEKFPGLLEQLEGAKKFIYLLYYIIEDDVIGKKIFEMLKKKAGEGLVVNVLYDDVGSSIEKQSIAEMKQAGIQIYAYMPVFFSRFAYKANYRNHRKIVVIDGEVGFVGGINIADRYINPNIKDVYWRDTHLMIRGEAVSDLQFLFINDWFYATGKKIEPILDLNFDRISEETNTAILGSDFGATYQSIMEAYFGIISNAKEEILLATPYFLPTEIILDALKIAAKSGIRIRLLIPRKPDMRTAFYASQSYLMEMLQSGVEVFCYTKGMMHAKTMVVDNLYSTVGSTNLDQRSFSLNSEVNAFFIDEAIAANLKSQFGEDLKDSYPLLLSSLKNRPWYKKALSSLARLFAPIL